jgi:hypothetical protein
LIALACKTQIKGYPKVENAYSSIRKGLHRGDWDLIERLKVLDFNWLIEVAFV